MNSSSFRLLKFASACALALSAANCAVDSGTSGGNGDEKLGKATALFTGANDISGSITGPTLWFHATPVTSGTASFLSGVSYDLSYPTYVQTLVTSGMTIEQQLSIKPASGHWTAAKATAVYPGPGYAVNNCVSTGTTSTVSLAHPSSGAFRCFLTEVSNLYGSSFGASGDEAQVWYDGSGSPHLSCYGNAEAWAQCIPITNLVVGGAWVGGTRTVLDLGAGVSGEECLLTAIWGTFRGSFDSLAWVEFDTNKTGANHWGLEAGNLSGASADCVQ